MTYYNEREPYAVAWLRNLAAAGHVAPGEVDGRSITEVKASDVAGFKQCHFFAGLGGWSHALRLAGVADDAPVWTGSCPCQPFSQAGGKRGANDDRHLWPTWYQLIKECRPPVVFGEQVSSPDGLNWYDGVATDLERAGYAVGALDISPASVGAPHIRQRLYFVALAHDYKDGRSLLGPSRVHDQRESGDDASGRSEDGGDSDTSSDGLEGRIITGAEEGPTRGPWAPAEWLLCGDGKRRAVEPGTFPLAHGATARVGRLRAYGNAIVPPLAAEFIRAALEAS